MHPGEFICSDAEVPELNLEAWRIFNQCLHVLLVILLVFVPHVSYRIAFSRKRSKMRFVADQNFTKARANV